MKTYIKINLNKAESSEVIKERRLEQTRWAVFGVLVFILFILNVRVWMIGFGYSILGISFAGFKDSWSACLCLRVNGNFPLNKI